MKIAVTILKNAAGANFVLVGGKAHPVEDIDDQKLALKRAATKGMRVGKVDFDSGMVISQHGIETRKSFPATISKEPAIEL